jgi:hypothetical protein
VLGTDAPLAGVEIDGVAFADVGRANAQPRMAGIEKIELNDPRL